tara:strand:+ start:81 stop:521 length:441 start_codon:yes stop_codon:yes gene_type:complete
MAHFAKIGVDNAVLNVVALRNINCVDEDGVEKESIGKEYLEQNTGHSAWVQCSVNTQDGVHKEGRTPLRGTFPSKGWVYDSTNDIFYNPNAKPYDSWVLNTTTSRWEPPTARPTETDAERAAGKCYKWNETNKAWELISGVGVSGA